MKYVIVCLFAVFVSINMNAQQCSDNLVNMSYSLNDVAYLSDETFIAIGSSGEIIKSDDAGKSWKEMNSGTSEYLLKIQFVTDSVGYIIGDYDRLLKTEDAGNNWFPLKVNNPGYPYCRGLYFMSPDTGFVFGGNSKIFKTHDGGRTWLKISTGTSETLNSISFLNKNEGFACGRSNFLMKTTDGGGNWESIDMDSYGFNLNFVKVHFVDENIGYLLEEDGLVIKTIDGGASWSKVGSAPTDYAVSMKFIDKNIGYIVGGWTMSTFYRTMNGGLTWQAVSRDHGGSISGIALNKTGNKGVIVGSGTGYGSSSESGRVISYFNESDNRWKAACNLNGSLDFWRVAFCDDKTGYLFGGYYQSTGVIYKTNDRGITWNPLPFHPRRNIYNSFIINKDTVYVCADSLYKTTDGGEHWTALSDKTGKLYIRNNTGWMLNSPGIYRTDSYGRNWEQVLTTNSFLTNFCFIDTIGYAVGYNCVYKSTDSGKTWSSYNGLPENYYQSVYFLNKDTGFVGGKDGLLFKTGNGGIKWDTINTDSNTSGIVDIKFKNTRDGYFLDYNNGGLSSVHITHDGGRTWKFKRQISERVTDLFLSDDGHIYFAGDRGVLMKITEFNPPTMPGYISGEQTVVKNTRSKYSVLQQSGASYNWTISNNQAFKTFTDSIIVNFQEKGKYKISVTLTTACGIGVPRTIEVTVLDSLIEPTAIRIKTTKDIAVYPNPFQDYLKIIVPNDVKDNVKLTFYNTQGKIAKTEEYRITYSDEISLDVSDLNEGIYILEIIQGSNMMKAKLIKQ